MRTRGSTGAWSSVLAFVAAAAAAALALPSAAADPASPTDADVGKDARREAAAYCDSAVFKKECRATWQKAREAINEIDKVFPIAISEGKAIVVVAALDLSHKYPDEKYWKDNLGDDVTDPGTSAAVDLSTVVEWREVTRADRKLIVGQLHGFMKVGAGGYLLDLPGQGSVKYQVYIVDPGTYRLARISYPLLRATPRDFARGAASHSSSVARASLVRQTFTETRIESQWFPDDYRTIPAQETCNLWYKGACTDRVYVPEQRQLTRRAGYYDVPVDVAVPGLDAVVDVPRGFAEFTVSAGESVVIDGYFPQPPHLQLAAGGCAEAAAGPLVCEIASLDLVHFPAVVDDVRRYGFSAEGFPRLGNILAGLKHRKLVTAARKVGQTPIGSLHRITAPEDSTHD
jgi:hypothetical protein